MQRPPAGIGGLALIRKEPTSPEPRLRKARCVEQRRARVATFNINFITNPTMKIVDEAIGVRDLVRRMGCVPGAQSGLSGGRRRR